ncbi:DUF397 domain-containing protein [Actinomadura alba]|uniref:DUF397 domain-containing protein n=1 Tax=Actinomadura alba TaxID=406431 RepID=A0ABR7LRV5_9ACTN|nr:DUF397 domain-containing protein [Actinomadura alba]MBC6467215.1 DUF397 domain-containing protein [Actinomadura alba]
MTSPIWRKSSRSEGGTSGQCVEVARLPHSMGVRDSKSPTTGHLTVSPDAFTALVQKIKNNDLDL